MKSEPRFVGIIGHHISHTLSPAMHTAAFRDLHLPFAYGVFDVTPEFLPALLASIRKHGCAGANVTIPHKQNVIPLLDEVQEDAVELGAVNTIVNRDGRLIGYNTDILGIKHSLDPFNEKIRGASVLILGAGGGARAAVYAVSKFFSPGKMRVHNRSVNRADKIVVDFRKSFPEVVYENVSNPGRLASAFAESTLVVNTTSLGMWPDIEALPIPGTIPFSNQQIIFDIIYNPVETALLRRAKMMGAQTINGVEMFVYQGARAFELWTGKTFPFDRALEVVRRALNT